MAPTFTSQTTGVCTVSGSTVHIVSAGTCTIRASQAGDSTYNAAPDVDQPFAVAQKSLTVTATGINKLYDGTTVATVTLSSDKVGSDDVTPSYTSATFATSTVGTGIGIAVSGISIGGSAASNYTLFNTTASTTANITTASATITLDTSNLSRVYDATAQSVPVLSTVPADLSYTVTYDGSLTPPTNVGTYAVFATITDPNYAGTDSATLTITARPVTVTAITDNKTYDGTTSSTGVPTITSGSLAGGDSVAWTQIFDTKIVGTGKTLTPSGTVSDGNSGNNYSYTFVADTTGEITTRAITVTAVANTKAYDGDTTALGVPTLTAGTLAAGDTGTFSESYDTKDAGSSHILTSSGTIADAGVVDMTGNYTITFDTISTGIITARPLTVTGITANNKTYDATTDATLSGGGVLSGVVGSEDVSLTGTPVGAFDDVNATTGKTVTISGFSLSGADIGNYSLTTPTATADIAERAITITAQPNTKTYDGTTDAAALPTHSADLQGTDTITDLAEVYDTQHAGTGKTLSVSAYTVNDGNSGANYDVTTVADHTGVIDQEAVTVTAAANTKVYDGDTTAVAVPTVTSGTIASGDTTNFAESYSVKTVGTGKTLTPSGTITDGNSGNNYIVTFESTLNGTITQKELTVSGVTAGDKTYDATTDVTLGGSGALAGVVPGDTVTLDGTLTGVFSSKNVGTHSVVVSGFSITGDDAANYSLTQPTPSATISAAPLSITAVTDSKVYDSTQSSSSTPTVSGLQASDSVTGLAQEYDNKNVGTGKTLSVSAYTVNDGNSGNNYTVTTNDDTTGVITSAALTITAQTDSKIYDGATTSSVTPIVVGLQGSDSVTGLAQEYDNKNVGTGKTLSVSAYTVNDGNSGANYAVTPQTDTTGVITQKTITITGMTADDKIYDATTTAALGGSGALQGIIGSDVVTSNTLSATGVFADKNVGAGKIVTISGVLISGGDADNYALTQPTATASITARALSVTAATNTKMYDGTTDAAAVPTITSGALQGSDTATFTESYNTKDAGTGKVLTPSGAANDGNGGTNYSYVFQDDTTGVITPAALSVSADAQTKYYGDADPTLTYATTSGSLFGSDAFSGALSRAAGENPGAYAIDQGTLTAGSDYTLTFTPNTLTILSALGLATSTSASSTTGTVSGAVTASTTSSGVAMTMTIPFGTEVSGPTAWDGVVNFPEATTTYTLTPDSGFTASAVSAVAIGAGDTALTFDKGVRLIFTGQAGKLTGWSRNGVFTPITAVCSADRQTVGDALAPGGDCKIDAGSDLVVWTKHFTTYVVYTQTAIPSTSGGNGGGGGGNGPVAGSLGFVGGQVLGAATSTVTTENHQTTAGGESYHFAKNLSIGSRGTDVIELQKILITGGFLKITAPTGYFGPATKVAVIAYQQAHSITPALGYVGTLTRAALNGGTTLSDEKASMIKKLQDQLKALLAKITALQTTSTTSTTTTQ
ncbi:peptidoglycan-binding protein [Candidatus Kaiserbacteria bacterium]|nr:peptidoglycan-binding protein [Candidatus Kaiserbacteria bacterium]